MFVCSCYVVYFCVKNVIIYQIMWHIKSTSHLRIQCHYSPHLAEPASSCSNKPRTNERRNLATIKLDLIILISSILPPRAVGRLKSIVVFFLFHLRLFQVPASPYLHFVYIKKCQNKQKNNNIRCSLFQNKINSNYCVLSSDVSVGGDFLSSDFFMFSRLLRAILFCDVYK